MQPYIPDRKPPIGALLNPYLSINRGLVYYPIMWEGAGITVEDASVNRNVGIISNATWTNGRYGPVLSYDGGDYVDIGNPAVLNIAGEITIVAGFNLTAAITFKPLICRWGTDQSYTLEINNPAGVIGFYIRVSEVNKGAKTTNTYNDGLYHQAAGIFNGSNVLINLDGGKEIITGDATPGPIDTPAQNVRIGAFNSIAGGYVGITDYFLIYNRALSNAEIVELYLEPFCGFRWMSIEQLASYYAGVAPPEIQALFMDLSTQLWTIKHAKGLFTKL